VLAQAILARRETPDDPLIAKDEEDSSDSDSE